MHSKALRIEAQFLSIQYNPIWFPSKVMQSESDMSNVVVKQLFIFFISLRIFATPNEIVCPLSQYDIQYIQYISSVHRSNVHVLNECIIKYCICHFDSGCFKNKLNNIKNIKSLSIRYFIFMIQTVWNDFFSWHFY